jgi:hypothetical protein
MAIAGLAAAPFIAALIVTSPPPIHASADHHNDLLGYPGKEGLFAQRLMFDPKDDPLKK